VKIAGLPSAPLKVAFVMVGSRLGWRWYGNTNIGVSSCEINWLDPEPDRGSSEYRCYIRDMRAQNIKRSINFYKGFHQPPTEEEYMRLCKKYIGS